MAPLNLEQLRVELRHNGCGLEARARDLSHGELLVTIQGAIGPTNNCSIYTAVYATIFSTINQTFEPTNFAAINTTLHAAEWAADWNPIRHTVRSTYGSTFNTADDAAY